MNGMIIAVAAIIYLSALSLMEMTILANRKSVLALFKFVENVNPRNFTEVPKASLLTNLAQDGVVLDKNTSLSFRMMLQSLKVFVAQDKIPSTDAVPSQVVTFPTMLGTWVFVPNRYERMNGLEKFQLLHEIGHLNMSALSLSKYNSQVGLLIVILTGFFVLFREGFSLLGVLLVLFVALLELAKTFFMSTNKLNCEIADEMEADHFAFRHAKAEWFKTFPASMVAEKFCRRSGHTLATQERWIKHFVDALETLRNGGSQHECLDRHFPKANYGKAISLINYMQAGAFLSAITLYSSPQLAEAIILLAIALIFSILVFLFSTSVKSMGEVLLRSFEKNQDKESLKHFMRKYVCWYTLNSNKHPVLKRDILDSARVFCLRQLESLEDEQGETAMSTECNQDKLFQSQADFDIYCDRQKAINYIFHQQSLNCEIDHLAFDIAQRRITIITKDHRHLDLGARIGWLVFPELAREQYIFIIRTKDGEALDGVEVFMKLVAS